MNISRTVCNKESVREPYPGTDHDTETWAADNAERNRHWIVNLVFIIYWLLIFEGVLRKWIFPDEFKILYFVRDPFVLIVYVLSVFNYRSLSAKPLLAGGLLLGLIALTVGLTADYDLMVLGYGWRNYFYYIPLAFVIGANFQQADLDRLLRQTLLVAIPIAALVGLQSFLPKDAIINAGLIEGGLYNAGTASGFVRTFGTFTSSPGQSWFVASLAAMFLANWMQKREQRQIKGFLLLIVGVAVAMNIVLSGSRGAYILVILIVLVALVSNLLTSSKVKGFGGILLFLIIIASTMAVTSIIAIDVLDAILERVEGAHYAELGQYGPLGTMGRIISEFGNFTNAIPLAPPLGYGVGWFGNAFANQFFLALYAEDDWSRNIFELGPVIGMLFISFRIALVVWLINSAVKAVKRVGNPLPLLLVGFIGTILLQGQITSHGSVNGYGWLFAGFCIAANRIGNERTGFR